MEPYADVIIDLSVKNVDRIFQYRIPDHLKELVKPGVQVNIPFGKVKKSKMRLPEKCCRFKVKPKLSTAKTERDRGRSLKRDRL